MFKTVLPALVFTFLAGAAMAGVDSYQAYTPIPPSASGGDSDASGALLILLVIGGLILLNNGGSMTTRNRSQLNLGESAEDDDVIMKF